MHLNTHFLQTRRQKQSKGNQLHCSVHIPSRVLSQRGSKQSQHESQCPPDALFTFYKLLPRNKHKTVADTNTAERSLCCTSAPLSGSTPFTPIYCICTGCATPAPSPAAAVVAEGIAGGAASAAGAASPGGAAAAAPGAAPLTPDAPAPPAAAASPGLAPGSGFRVLGLGRRRRLPLRQLRVPSRRRGGP